MLTSIFTTTVWYNTHIIPNTATALTPSLGAETEKGTQVPSSDLEVLSIISAAFHIQVWWSQQDYIICKT